MNRTPRILRAVMPAVVAMTLIVACPSATPAQGNPNPGVLPPDAKAYGMTYGEWGAEWWNWAFSSPIEVNPLTDTTGEFCDTNQSGPVWFLAGFLDLAGTGGPLLRTCEVPSGKALFFPIINSVFIATDGESEEEAREAVNSEVDMVTVVEADIDGVDLRDLWRYRAESPAYTQVLPEGAIIDQLLGITGEFLGVTDGFWLMLAPLPVGDHVIHFRGVVGDPDDPVFEVEIFYLLTVVPGR